VLIDRKAAVDYAKKYWNRVTDDDKFWLHNEVVALADKRKSMNAPASEGWEAFFVPDGNGGENAVFRRTVPAKIVDGKTVPAKTEDKRDPIATNDDLDDCTHYVCRCLIKEGIALTETPRANELAEAMIKSPNTKMLAEKTTQKEGQKVIDSGIFKPGDLVAYYKKQKGRYGHNAMFVGKQTSGKDDPGGITCHSLCRFEGLTQVWNGATDDVWFLSGELSYTLIHFSEDDPKISADTLKWLPGWWKIGNDFYFVKENGHAFLTPLKPKQASQKLPSGSWVGYYFEAGSEVVFVWRKLGGKVQVERWTAPTKTNTQEAALKIDGFGASATRVF
jgi:hypothetical protein